MLESTLQSKFIAKVKKLQLGLAVKVDSSSRRGWPDIVYIDWKGDTAFIEFKADGGKLSNHQEVVHAEILALGADIMVITGEGRLNHFIETLERERTFGK